MNNMELHTLSRKNAHRSSVQVGRGGKRGKTSGRGGKGQTARAGNKPRPQMRDIIKKLPKLRGRGKNSNKSVVAIVAPVNLSLLELHYGAGEKVTRGSLLTKGLVKRNQGVLPQVKILATGELTKKLLVSSDINVSASARTKIEAVGGAII